MHDFPAPARVVHGCNAGVWLARIVHDYGQRLTSCMAKLAMHDPNGRARGAAAMHDLVRVSENLYGHHLVAVAALS
jgi:hypothetical protein